MNINCGRGCSFKIPIMNYLERCDDMRRILSTVIIVLGVATILLGFYLMTDSRNVYFTAENVTLSPGEARDILVTPNAEIVLEYRDLPLCQGARLIFFDHTGNPVYEISGFGNADHKIPNNCNTGECIYKVRYDLPRD